VLFIAHLCAGIRLKRTVDGFLDQTAPTVLTGRIHLLAHSLGTLIVCRALRRESLP
jgi:esterase/lipase superfamily enzyme